MSFMLAMVVAPLAQASQVLVSGLGSWDALVSSTILSARKATSTADGSAAPFVPVGRTIGYGGPYNPKKINRQLMH